MFQIAKISRNLAPYPIAPLTLMRLLLGKTGYAYKAHVASAHVCEDFERRCHELTSLLDWFFIWNFLGSVEVLELKTE